MFTNSNWFAFQDEKMVDDVPMSATSPSEQMDEINLNGTSNGGNNSSDDEVVIGEDEDLVNNRNSNNNGTYISNPNPFIEDNLINDIDLKIPNSKASSAPVDEEPFADRPMPERVAWGERGSVSGLGVNPFLDYESTPNANDSSSLTDHSSDSSQQADVASCLVEDVELVGAESGGSEKAMDQALKEGCVGEAGPLKKQVILNEPKKENPDQSGPELGDFNDSNYWRVDQKISISE